MSIIIHTNLTLAHQYQYAKYFKQGFDRHGLKSEITSDRFKQADVHIVQGPHYAKDIWLNHPNVILLDVAYYHPERTTHPRSMDWVSIGWMNEKGGRDFIKGAGRKSPEIGETQGTKTLFLADFNGPIEQADTIRLHPANKKYPDKLEDVFKEHGTAIGYNTSALVQAGLAGLKIICKSEINIMAQPNWLELLPYAEWNYTEIKSGELWEHLLLSRRQLRNQSV